MPRLSKIGAAALGAFGWTSGSSISASYLVVAGGGAGAGTGSGGGGGGGGAGGMQTGTTSLSPTLSYTVTVGAGGTFSGATAYSGNNSQFGTLTASVGGGGGGGVTVAGLDGGSGGGGGSSFSPYGTKAGGSATSGQGSAGGAGSYDAGGSSALLYGGGGGGKGGAGGAATTSSQGAAGAGSSSSISGSAVTYAAGATGGGYNIGGNTPGTANTGNGGTGGGGSVSAGQGGSGIVIISYAGAQQFGGGVVTSSGGNTIHTFNTSGTLAPLSSLTANFLVVAGGGGAGSGGGAGTNNGAGGGAGSFRTSAGTSGGGGSAESTLTIDTNSTYLVTVGAGGSGASGYSPPSNATNGSNSLFFSITSTGGGYGGSQDVVFTGQSGASGGSGGGGSASNGGGSGTTNQGYAGGSGNGTIAGGGGGAGETGNTDGQGEGGDGVASSISGSSVTYAGGGGGGVNSSGGSVNKAGGTGGGGQGGYLNSSTNTAGTANTGGGGGGGGGNTAGTNGGSGIVIISYAGATQSMAGGTVTISGGNVIHTFTSSGYLTPLKYVGNSLRFNSVNSTYLSRTFTSSGSSYAFTQSIWFKRGTLSAYQQIGYGFTSSGSVYSATMRFSTTDTLDCYIYYNGSSWTAQLSTTQVFRDPAAWYHLVLAVDTAQATSSNRLKLYINGVQVTAFSTANYPSQNTVIAWNSTGNVSYLINSQNTIYTFDGYTAELNYIDGLQLTPNSFGTFNSYGVWQPIIYKGSYGTNGFYLPFTSNSSTYTPYFPGSSSINAPANTVWQFASDFTIEAFLYRTSTGDASLFVQNSGANYFALNVNAGTGINIYLNSVGVTIAVTDLIPQTNRWNHIALVRSSGVIKVYLNGIASSTTYSSSSTFGYNLVMYIAGLGTAAGGSTVGYVSNARIATSALYTSNFTPSTTALTAVSTTQLLTCQNATFVDNSTNNFTITTNGSAVTGALYQSYPFTTSIFNDQSPQGNNWTPNNISGASGSTLDYMTDVPTLTSTTAANYCVLNPLNLYTGTSCANGNLQGTTVTGAECGIYGTMAMTSGKFYWESTPSSISSGGCMIGIAPATTQGSSGSPGLAVTTGYGYYTTGNKYAGSGGVAYGNTFTTSDVIGCALDLTNGKIWWSKNGVWQASGDPAAGTNAAFTSVSGTFVPGIGNGGAGSFSTVNVNFGQQPFTYTAPSGFLALNTYNI